MSTLLDPDDFAERLDRSFADEPGHAPVAADLRAGRRRLRRRRAGRSVAALAVVGVVAASYAALAPDRGGVPIARDLSDAQVVARCLNTRSIDSWQRHDMSRAELARVMGRARLMTRARSTYDVHATVRSADRKSWLSCTLPQSGRSREGRVVALYRTSVAFPSRTLDGRRVYEEPNESDPRVFSTSQEGLHWDVDCFPTGVREDTRAFAVASSRCATYSVVWNDRRPAEVARARITNPDGSTGWADVSDGYLSYSYSGRMTHALRREVATSEPGGYGRVPGIVLYDAAGHEIARGEGPGSFRAPTINNYPSLAYTFRRDRSD